VERRGVGLAAFGAGLLVIVAARLALPAAPPLYDGVVPLQRYLWLDPPPGHPGGAKSAVARIPVPDGRSPLVVVATAEAEPQAQMFAPPDGLVLPTGTTLIRVSIKPIATEGVPADGHIDGNVYRFSVTDEHGAGLTAHPSARVSVALRSADPTLSDATIERYADGSWQPIKTSPAGFGGTFLAVVTEFGDLAVVAPGPDPYRTASPPPGPPESLVPGSSVPAATGGMSPGAGPTDTASTGLAGLPWSLLAVAALLAFGVAILRIRARKRRPPDGW